MTPWTHGSAYRSFFGRHPLLREVRNCAAAIAVGLLILAVVVL